jgi:superfamily II DNA/RNA helicase
MLDMGFIPDIERIVKLLPFTRQTLFFSATMPPEITQLVDRFLSNPVRVEVSKPASTGEHIIQQLVTSGGKPDEKRATLRQLIDAAGADLTNAIIFCNRKRDVATLYRSLERHGYSVGSLHGDMDQYARLKTLDSFRDGQIKLLVASDVAARGLDIPAVSHVFNFDVPTHSEDYVHRIGRTGRAGRPGLAQTIVTRAETKYIQQIEKLTGKPIEWAAKPDALDHAATAPRERASHDEAAPAEAAEGRNRRRGRHAEGEGRSRRGGRDRQRGDREARPPRADTPRHDAPARSDVPARADAPRHERPERPARSEHPVRAGSPSRPRAPEAEDASRAVGFSDHVPAFLLRPVRLPSSAEALEEV